MLPTFFLVWKDFHLSSLYRCLETYSIQLHPTVRPNIIFFLNGKQFFLYASANESSSSNVYLYHSFSDSFGDTFIKVAAS